MFTGLIQDVGEVIDVKSQTHDVRLKIQTNIDLTLEKIGASIACSGCCLTVIEKGDDWFSVDVSHETISKTNIGSWGQGTKVNIEPSLRLGDEMGGHIVSGHVDGLAELIDVQNDGESKRLKIKPPRELLPLIASKGSVALDGISLTVNEVEADHFGVNIIPHTWDHTSLKQRQAGDAFHIEIDMLARYVARQLSCSVIPAKAGI